MNALPPPPPSGYLVLDKPAGVSSAKALNAVKRRFGKKTKVGHAGTLDPFATGCLVVLVGKATKTCEKVMGLPKGYLAELKLGATTATLDPESPEEPAPDITPPPRETVEAVIAKFVGTISQRPPAFSAIKVGGRRAYDLARQGGEVDLPPRDVIVHSLKIVHYDWPTLTLAVESGRGFYVRSLARDVAEALGTTGYLTALRRTHVGPFHADQATGVEGELLPLEILE